MLDETLKTEKGRFLLRHLHNCQKCYKAWQKESANTPAGKTVTRLEEIVDINHRA